MKRFICLVCIAFLVRPLIAAEQPPRPLIRGLKNPSSITAGADGRVYVTTLGEIGMDGDGSVIVIDKGKAVPFVAGLDDPRGIVARAEWLFVADKNRVWRIDRQGKPSVFAAANAFSPPARSLGDLDIDEMGTLYVADAGEGKGGGAVYRIAPNGKVALATDAKRSPALPSPSGLVLDGMSHVLSIDAASGHLLPCASPMAARTNSATASGPAASFGTSLAGCIAAMGPTACL